MIQRRMMRHGRRRKRPRRFHRQERLHHRCCIDGRIGDRPVPWNETRRLLRRLPLWHRGARPLRNGFCNTRRQPRRRTWNMRHCLPWAVRLVAVAIVAIVVVVVVVIIILLLLLVMVILLVANKVPTNALGKARTQTMATRHHHNHRNNNHILPTTKTTRTKSMIHPTTTTTTTRLLLQVRQLSLLLLPIAHSPAAPQRRTRAPPRWRLASRRGNNGRRHRPSPWPSSIRSCTRDTFGDAMPRPTTRNNNSSMTTTMRRPTGLHQPPCLAPWPGRHPPGPN